VERSKQNLEKTGERQRRIQDIGADFDHTKAALTENFQIKLVHQEHERSRQDDRRQVSNSP
jgi:hypothetical protein